MRTLWIGVLLTATVLAACGGSADSPAEPVYSPEQLADGEALFQQTCFACHGPDAKGLPNLGKDLTMSEFVKISSDAELLAYVMAGRTADDPLNTTGIAMPPKGGFDFLTEDDIGNIIAFVRSLEEQIDPPP